jgi:hypothetical protein
MRKLNLLALLGSCLLATFVVSTQAYGGHDGGPRFTNKSLEGTYYIACACEGNETSTGGSIHSAGMGKIVFDGKGAATITQQNLYTEIANTITRLVKDGVPLAQFSGSYAVDSEGYGVLFDGAFPPKDSDFSPSFMVTKANGKEVTEIYLILPQNFIDFTPEPKHLIHVTAAQR